MKTLLLVLGCAFVLDSCIDASTSPEETISIEEMKARVPAEEIVIEEQKTEVLSSGEEKMTQSSDPKYGQCMLEPGCMADDSIERPDRILCAYPPPMQKEEVVDFPDAVPEFPGGSKEMIAFIENNLSFPFAQNELYGSVYISFIVGKEGRIRDVKVEKGMQKDFDEEALRVIRMMPNWIPGEQAGKKVAAKVLLPIRYKSY